jgi:hypothetical protein
VSFDDWILALHVLSAFAYVAGMVLFSVLVFAARRSDLPGDTIRMQPVGRIGNIVVGIGAGGTILLGIWLAFSYGGYDIWDPWIIAALVLWVVAAAIGQRTAAEYTAGLEKAKELEAAGQTGPSAELLALNRTQRGLWLHIAGCIVVVVILVDMIWKPGS